MTDRVQLRRAALEWRLIDGEIVALDTRRSLFLAVNRTGATLWPALTHGATREELSRTLAEAFNLSPEHAARDVHSFLVTLEEEGLLASEAD